jgi:antitoxin component HigA of HigAB toxin-antitoxin module
MELLPIKTEADYQKALEEIEALFDAAPNTAEFDRLDILPTLVEAYEKKHCPIELPDPIREDRGLYRAMLVTQNEIPLSRAEAIAELERP